MRKMIIQLRHSEAKDMVVLSAALMDAIYGPLNTKYAAKYLDKAQGTIENKVSLMDIPHHKQMGTKFSRAEIWKAIFESEHGMNLKKVG